MSRMSFKSAICHEVCTNQSRSVYQLRTKYMSESQRASTCHESLSRVPYVAKYTRVTKDVAVTNYAYESAAQGEHVSYMYGSHEIFISYELL